jgi:hypothetical protein
MADPTELERMREARKLANTARDYLQQTERLQQQRWHELEAVVDSAITNFLSMRIGALEQRNDDALPQWFSIILTVGVTLLPVSAWSTLLLSALCTGTQKLVTIPLRFRMRHSQLAKQTHYPQPAKTWLPWMEQAKGTLKEQIVQRENAVFEFWKRREPEIANSLQDAAHGLAQTAANWLYVGIPGKQPESQAVAKKVAEQPLALAFSRTTDEGVTSVSRTLKDWISRERRTEGNSIAYIANRISVLEAIAGAADPAEESKVQMQIAKAEEERREKRFRRPVYEVPKTYADASEQLIVLCGMLTPTEIELAQLPSAKSTDELEKPPYWDLQLMIEQAIWATTFDFTLKPLGFGGGPINKLLVYPPFPESLWEKLTDHFIDPEGKGKTFKKRGPQQNLGRTTDLAPRNPFRKKWSPTYRLSYYLSMVVADNLHEAYLEQTKKLRTIRYAP